MPLSGTTYIVYERLLCDVGSDGFDQEAQETGSIGLIVYGGTNISRLPYTSGILHVAESSMR